MLFNAGLIIMGLIGVYEAAAYQIALNVASLAFMLAYGMSMAGAVRIGLAKGAGNSPATRRASSTTLVASVCAIMVLAIPITLFPDAANQLLRGLKDVKWPMLFTGISYWVVGFPVAYILALKTEVGANGVWYGLMAGLIVAAILLGARLIRQLR